MAHAATINATPEQSVVRNIGRIKRLRMALEKTQTEERRQSLTAEHDRLMAEIQAFKAEIDTL